MATLAEIDAEIQRRQAPSLADIDAEIARRQQAPPEGGAISQVLEPAAALVSGALAEPIAGIAGIAQAINPFAEPGAGAQAVEATREALTFQPRTQAGQAGLQAVGEAVAPVAETLTGAEEALGEATFEATGSPLLATAAKTLPTALLELAGVATAKGLASATRKVKAASTAKNVNTAISDAAPSIDRLKTEARAVYTEIDNLGVRVKKRSFSKLAERLRGSAKKEGFNKRIHPKVSAALDEFAENVGREPKLSEVDTMRKVAQAAAKSIEPDEARLGSRMIDDVDSFLDDLGNKSLVRPPGVNVGAKYREARGLWSRAKKAEVINEAMEKAALQASGFENGIRTQFRSILNNKKRSRGFSADEKAAMKKVVVGGGVENVAKFLGKFGFSAGQSSGFFGPIAAVTGGGLAGGVPGAVVVPLIGSVSKKLAENLTRANARFADEIVRSGKDAKKIAATYLKNTPKARRSADELTELLVARDADISAIIRLPQGARSKQMIEDAAFLAKQAKEAKTVGSGIAGTELIRQTDEE